MNRTRKRKLIYVVLAAVGAALGIWIATRPTLAFGSKVVIGLLLLVPGRINAFLLRGLYTSMRAFNNEQYQACLDSAVETLRDLERHPWKGRLSFGLFYIYSTSAWSLAFNSLGAAHLCLGNVEEAERALQESTKRDALNPLPYANLAVLESIRGAPERSAEHARRARDLGYTGGASDAVVQRVDELYARLAGRRVALSDH